MTQIYLKQEHHIYRDSLRKFLEKEAVPYIDEWEANKEIPRSFWKKLGKEGFLCPQVEEGFAVVSSEEFDRVNVGLIGIGLHNDISMPYIESYANEAQKERWLPGAVSGDIISAIAMTEPNTGSDLANIQTTAILDGDDYVLNGEKTFITNGHIADIVIVVANTD